MTQGASDAILSIDDLYVSFFTRRGVVEAAKGVNLEIRQGEMLGLVGGSGSGKSVTAWSVLNMVPSPGRILGGRITYKGQDLLSKDEDEMRTVRGEQISVVVQNPRGALNPFLTVMNQASNAYRAHHDVPKPEARQQVLKMLEAVGLADPERVALAYPHELSGGMAQRVLVAMALGSSPDLLLADEPTSNLDVTIQAQIMNLIRESMDRLGLTVVLITHDLGLVAQYCDRAAVMTEGEVVETKEILSFFREPEHEYSIKLLTAMRADRARGVETPSWDGIELTRFPSDSPVSLDTLEVEQGDGAQWRDGAEETVPASRPLGSAGTRGTAADQAFIRVENLSKEFGSRGSDNLIKAVNDVSFAIPRGSTLAIVGESGSGKSTVARCLLRLIEPTSGRVNVGGTDVLSLNGRDMRSLRRDIQMVFQDPLGSLTPRMRVGNLIEEPLLLHTSLNRPQRKLRALELMEQMELDPTLYYRYPRQLSGGQQQRVNIARAIASNPRFVVLDEPTSALDLAIRGEILDLLARLQRELNLTYLLISHDLRTVQYHSDQVAVMYLGKIVEIGPPEEIFLSQTHPYTRGLLSSLPTVDPASRGLMRTLTGEIPSPVNLPPGCHFYNRCPFAQHTCQEAYPPLEQVAEGRWAACYRAKEDLNALEEAATKA